MEDLLLVLGLILTTAIASGVLIPLLTTRPERDDALATEVAALEELTTVS